MGKQDNRSDKLPPMERQDFGFLLLYAILVPLLGPIIGIITGISNRRRRGSDQYMGIAFLILILEFLSFIGLAEYIPAREKAMEAETRSNVHLIQIGLERYAVNHQGIYPPDSQTLIEQNYLSAMPDNPFTKAPMKDIPFGSSPFEGEFTYVPVFKDNQVYGFYLIGYGKEKDLGQDVDGDSIGDHVIIVIDSGSAYSGPPYHKRDPSFPSLEELLRNDSP
jgi:hypothetical protein